MDQVAREKENFKKAEEKWRSRAELMKKLEDQIRVISTSNLSKEKEMKTKLEANNRIAIEAKQAEMDALEKMRGTVISRNKTPLFFSAFEAETVRLRNFEKVATKLQQDLALEKRKVAEVENEMRVVRVSI